MTVEKIFLQHFRNFSQREAELNGTTLLFGRNGSGKTSVMEGLYLLSHGESFRAGKIDEMVAFDEELARLGVRLVDNASGADGEADRLEITLTRGKVQGKRSPKRLYKINDAGKQRKNFVGQFMAVVFQPEDMRLVEGSPGRRRDFIDSVLRLVDQQYAQSLHTYEQSLKRLNRFLEQVREGEQPRSVLKYWELALVKHGQIVQARREEFFDFLREMSSPFEFDVRYKISLISEKDIDARRDRAIAAGYMLVGPHKDDFEVMFAGEGLENRELSVYGSRGQQRLGVLWLKLGELKFLEAQRDEKPLLLLDDIFSELDEESAKLVLKLIGKYQTVITTADEDTKEFLEQKLKDLSVVEMNSK